MDDMASFKLHIYKYTLLIAVLFELGSLPFLCFDLKYLYGLVFGVVVSILSFEALIFMSKTVLRSGKKSMAVLGYFVRLPLYGIGFYMSMKAGGVIAGIACLLGFLTTTVAIIFVHGIRAKYSTNRTVRPEVQAEFEREDRERELKEELKARGEAYDDDTLEALAREERVQALKKELQELGEDVR